MSKKPIAKKEGLHEFARKIIEIKQDVGKRLFMLGALLKAVRDRELWREQYDTFNSFLGDPEISMSRGQASKIIKVFEVFAMRKDAVQGIEMEKLYLITGVCKKADDETLVEWIGKARTLSRSDLKDAIRETAGEVPKHSLSLDEKIALFLGEIQPAQYAPDQRKDDWEVKFSGLIKAWEAWAPQT